VHVDHGRFVPAVIRHLLRLLPRDVVLEPTHLAGGKHELSGPWSGSPNRHGAVSIIEMRCCPAGVTAKWVLRAFSHGIAESGIWRSALGNDAETFNAAADARRSSPQARSSKDAPPLEMEALYNSLGRLSQPQRAAGLVSHRFRVDLDFLSESGSTEGTPFPCTGFLV